ncbi:MAG: hypothetical protein JSU66_07690 [Deltaproteobacteria bacterium]|nr:MAG: hypothetical protein JSU66_07690 [Deltaproteobacteria bacterium]
MPQRERPGPETPERETPATYEEPRRLEDWIRPLFTDSTLWPLLIVAILSLVTFGSAILLLAIRTRNHFALAALVILAWLSADASRSDLRRRRLGPVSGLILAVWSTAGLVAVAAVALGLF